MSKDGIEDSQTEPGDEAEMKSFLDAFIARLASDSAVDLNQFCSQVPEGLRHLVRDQCEELLTIEQTRQDGPTTGHADSDLRVFVDDFIAQHVSGGEVNVDQFCTRVPGELRDRVRDQCSAYLGAVEPLLARSGAAEPAPSLKKVGDFCILRELGRGGMGTVYLAWQVSLRRPVALKILHGRFPATGRHMRRFHREGISAGKLQHPFIVRILSVGESDGLSYLAMDYIDGASVWEELEILRYAGGDDPPRRGLLSPFNQAGYGRQVAQIILRAAQGLQFAHEHGIVHRDIKPQNIMLCEGDRPRIVDFGLAKEAGQESLSHEGDLLGTLSYMSPEQALAKRVKVDHRTDIFSLGTVLYEMLTLRRAFEGETMDRVLYEISFKEPTAVNKVNPAIHRDLATICERALEKNPERRFATMEDMAVELQRFLNNETLQIRPTPGVVRMSRAVMRSSAAKAAIVCVVLFLISLPFIMDAWADSERERRRPKITITHVVAGSQVFVRRIDMVTGEVGDPTLLGVVPIERESVDPGYLRIEIVDADGRFVEITRYLGEQQVMENPVVNLKSASDVQNGMVTIPAGEHSFGSKRAEVSTAPEAPFYKPRKITLPSFMIDVHEVSIGDYKKYAASTRGLLPKAFLRELKKVPEFAKQIHESTKWDAYPLALVSLEEARLYAAWCGKRLPTVFEWSRAAGGEEGRPYPWKGDHPAHESFVRMDNRGKTRGQSDIPTYLMGTVKVHDMGAGSTPEGLYHMLGNVREWTDTPNVRLAGQDGNPSATAMPAAFFEMGHGWNTPFKVADDLILDLRVYYVGLRERTNLALGFRCAKSIRD